MVEEEEGHFALLNVVVTSASAAIGAPTLFETAMVLHSRKGPAGGGALSRFLEENEIATVPFDESHAELACRAFARYGRGRHPAKLNYGDCMTYAIAKGADAPLLFVGDDFAKTDLAAA